MTEAKPSEAASVPRPWGYWATFGWALLAFIASVIVIFGFILWRSSGDPSRIELLHEDGGVRSLAIIVSAPIQIAVLVLAARLARWPAGKYLGLIRPRGRDLAVGIAGLGVLDLASMGLAYVLGKHSGATFLLDFYKSARAAGALAPLWLAVVIVAPFSEEIMFRGFLHRGWVRSSNRGVIAVVVISLLWSAWHVQYDWFGISQVFVVGLWYGFMRWTSGSTTLTFLLHGLKNFFAMVLMTIKVESLS